MANEGNPRKWSLYNPSWHLWDKWTRPQAIYLEAQSSLELWTVPPKGIFHSETRALNFHSILGDSHEMGEAYGWLETGKFKWWMNWWYLKSCTSYHFPGPRAISLMSHSEEEDTFVLTHQWQTNRNSGWYPSIVKENSSGPHMRSTKTSYTSLIFLTIM